MEEHRRGKNNREIQITWEVLIDIIEFRKLKAKCLRGIKEQDGGQQSTNMICVFKIQERIRNYNCQIAVKVWIWARLRRKK